MVGLMVTAALGAAAALSLVAPQKEKPMAARAFDFVVAVGFAASGCLVGVEVVVAADFFASRRVA